MPLRPRLQVQTLPRRGGFRQRHAAQADLLRLEDARSGCWPGVISGFSVAPANAHDLSVVPELVESTRGVAVGDRNYWSPKMKEQLALGMGVELLVPYRSKKRDPAPRRSAFLSRLRYRIDTVFSQLTGRYSVKRVWAKDLWHLPGRQAA